jgi:hypothetical protein
MKPDLVRNILALDPRDIPFRPEVIWASPPCTHFSVASIGRNWTKVGKERIPKTAGAEEAIAIVKKTLTLIGELRPRYWFIENPRGMLRSLPLMEPYIRRTVTYCQYGDTRMKPTDIWTNCLEWRPKPPCRNGDPCHDRAPRGTPRGTQALKGAKERGVIPPLLMEEVLSACERGMEGDPPEGSPLPHQAKIVEY